MYAELKPGDALFMHCNTLHCSGANATQSPRASLICCYNTKRNDPFKSLRHPGYSMTERVDDNAIMEAALSAVSLADEAEYASFEPIDTSQI